MGRLIDADALKHMIDSMNFAQPFMDVTRVLYGVGIEIDNAPTIDAVNVVRCRDCRKSHIDGKTTHYLWCTEWGRSTDTFGYCERGKKEGER